MQRRLFALDHNFPEPVLLGLGKALPMVELVPIRDRFGLVPHVDATSAHPDRARGIEPGLRSTSLSGASGLFTAFSSPSRGPYLRRLQPRQYARWRPARLGASDVAPLRWQPISRR